MSKFYFLNQLTNLELTGGQFLATSATGGDLRVGDCVTNAKVGANGMLAVAEDGGHNRYWTINGALTNISLDVYGRFNTNDHPAEIDHVAKIQGFYTTIPLDANGQLVLSPAGVSTTKIVIGGSITNLYLATGGGIAAQVVTPPLYYNLLMETGDDILQETGDKILLEN